LHFYKDQNDKEGQEFIMNKVDQTVNNLSSTLNNLLDVISIRSDGNLKMEEISFEEVFLKLKQTYQGEIMKYDANILHDFAKAQKIDYFAPYLESIMQNLLSNALKYSNPNTKPTVKFETYIQDNCVFMKVSDNGLGIDMARNGKHLFGFNKIFHKHPDAKGVGLFITKEQIESLGGEISAESEVGKGTTFTIIFNNNTLNN
jgi:signal transduction histidine kinase